MSYKLLVADDAVDELNVLVFLIHRFQMPFEIHTAHDGADAMQQVRDWHPDAVLTDIQMPMADGLEIASAVRELCPDSITVIISAHDDFSYARKALQLGVEDYLLKPIRPQEIETVMNQVRKKLEERKSRKKLDQIETIFIRKHLLTQMIATPAGKTDKSLLRLAEVYLQGYNTAYLFCAVSGYFEKHLDEFEKKILQSVPAALCLSVSDTSELVLSSDSDLPAAGSSQAIVQEAADFIRRQSACPVRTAMGTFSEASGLQPCFAELSELTENAYRFPGHTVLHREWYSRLSDQGSGKTPDTSSGSRIHEIQQFISTHYDEDLSLERLARIVYVNPDYLSRIFKRETGQNLNQYIRMYRMEKAKELLRSTRRKVSEIGHAVGYLNDSYFIHNFSDYTGVTPEKYRDQKGIG